MNETNDYLLALNEKFDLVQLPLKVETKEGAKGSKLEYYKITPNQRLFILGYTLSGIFQAPIENTVFTPYEQYFYKVGGFQTSFLKDKYFRNDTEIFLIYVRTIR